MRAFIISLLFIISGILGFLCQMLYANYFGLGKEMDIYFSLISIPAIFIGATGTVFSSLFFPAFARIAQSDLDSYVYIVKRYVSWAAIIIALIGFSVTIFNLNRIIDTEESSYFNLALVLNILFWLNAYMCIINGYLGSVQNYFKNFLIVSFSSLLVYICIIVFVVLFHNVLGVKSIAVGLVVASVLSFIINRFYGNLFHKSNKKVIIETKTLFSNILFIIISFLPFHVFASIAYLWAGQLNDDGSVSLLGYAHSFCAFLSSVASMGIATVSFPDLAKSLSSSDTTALQKGYLNFRNQLEVVLVFATYVAVFASFFAQPLIEVLFMRGKFDSNTADALSLVLPIYLVNGIIVAMMNLTRNVFYSINRQRIFAIFSCIATIIFIVSSILMATDVDYIVIGVVETLSMGIFAILSLLYINSSSHIFEFKYVVTILAQMILLALIGWLLLIVYKEMIALNMNKLLSIIICGVVYSLLADILLSTLIKNLFVITINKKILAFFK